jgi:LDH2 family malate/lactate/ureidoglycolate dehydrogenase
MLDVLCGVLTGGGFSNSVLGLYKGTDRPINAGHFFAAIRIDNFIPLDDFRQRMDQLIEAMRNCPPAPGVDRIYTPGEIEHETEQKRRREGIPINATLREELINLAAALGVKSPF